MASKSLNRAMFTSSNLPSVGEDSTYQLWTLQSGSPRRDNLLSGGTAVKQWFSGDVATSDQLAISIEPAGGSQTPTGPNILAAPKL